MRNRYAALFLALMAYEQHGSAADSLRPLQPFIESIFPSGGTRGTDTKVSIRGKNLDHATAVRISGGGVIARIIRNTESEILASFAIAKEAEPGRRDVRVVTPQGSFVQVFEVGSLLDQMESEPNDEPAKAAQLQLPIVINGKISSGDYDHFRFHAEAGQTILCDLQSSRLGTRFDGVLWVLDSTGLEVAFADDSYFDKDPRIVFTPARTGEYVLRVSGFRESGTAAATYRLLVGATPHADTVFPAGGRRGKSADVTLSGVNLNLITGLQLGNLRASISIAEKSGSRLRARVTIPADSAPGVYSLRLRLSNAELPNALPFIVSDMREENAAGGGQHKAVDASTPVVMNGVIRDAHQKDTFLIDVAAGERWTFQGDAMTLGNFLDPAITISDESGKLIAYMDETAPNGFDKEPTTVDFRLVHRFETAGRYRVELRDAALRGHETFVYRLLIGKIQPHFDVYVQTNQVSVSPGQSAILPVRVRRFGGWDAPVEVWVESLPARIESKRMVAEPVNTRFRGTFSEDFFFDGTNVELPMQAHDGAKTGAVPLTVRARGTFQGHTMEASAAVHYPWQQTGYLRGPASDQQVLLTVAPVPLFDLEGPASARLDSSGAADIVVSIRWLGAAANKAGLKLHAPQLPQGVEVERTEISDDAGTAHVHLRAAGRPADQSVSISIVGSMETVNGIYRKAARDIELTTSGGTASAAGGSAP